MDSEIAEVLDDPVVLQRFLTYLARAAAAGIASDTTITMPTTYIESALEVLVTRHCRIVFDNAQSPIERIWMNSLQTQFLRSSSMLVTTPPISDFPSFYDSFQRTLLGVDEFLKRYAQTAGDISKLDEYFDRLVASGRMDSSERDGAYATAMDYGVLPYRHAFHMTLQAGFPKTGPQGQNIRIDALIWHPAHPNLRVAVECDGYAYHSSRDAFTRDRQRDRRLNALGIRVFRFSGAEINRSPPEAVGDLYQFLIDAQ